MKNVSELIISLSIGFIFAINPLCAVNISIEVIGGFDGANPQSNDSIIQEAANRFRIKPFNEEGSNDSYYFRFNSKVINHSKEPQGVELIIEWPVLKTNPNYPYDTYYYGDIGNWKWTYAHIEGTQAMLHITVPPGTSYVGCYPRYSYEYFDEFMNNLKQSKDVTRWVEGKSFYDRNIWCVKITDAKIEGWNIKSKEYTLDEPNTDVTPTLTYSDFIAPDSTGLGRNFIVSVRVTNDAKVGSSILESREYLYIDGRAQGYKRIALAPGESKVLLWPYVKLHSPGKHQVSISGNPPKTIIGGEDHFFPVKKQTMIKIQ